MVLSNTPPKETIEGAAMAPVPIPTHGNNEIIFMGLDPKETSMIKGGDWGFIHGKILLVSLILRVVLPQCGSDVRNYSFLVLTTSCYLSSIFHPSILP